MTPSPPAPPAPNSPEETPPPPFRPSRPVAIVLTALLVAGAAHDQLSDGKLSSEYLLAILVLVALWSGQKIDGFLGRWLGK